MAIEPVRNWRLYCPLRKLKNMTVFSPTRCLITEMLATMLIWAERKLQLVTCGCVAKKGNHDAILFKFSWQYAARSCALCFEQQSLLFEAGIVVLDQSAHESDFRNMRGTQTRKQCLVVWAAQ